MNRDDAVMMVARLARVRHQGALDRVLVGAERLKHAQAVLVDVNSGAGRAQLVGAFMHAHLPSPLRQRAGGREAGESGTDDFGAAGSLMRYSEGGRVVDPGRTMKLLFRHWIVAILPASNVPRQENAMARLRHFAVW